MGRHAVTLLIDLIEGREPGELHRTLGTELVLRRSTQPPEGPRRDRPAHPIGPATDTAEAPPGTPESGPTRTSRSPSASTT